MLGPFSLRYIHLFVEQRSAGAFILSRRGRSADFVGLSSDDLVQTLGAYQGGNKYRYFWFSYAASPKEASDLASYWYHRYRPPDNVDPPHVSAWESWRCTITGCSACALERQKV